MTRRDVNLIDNCQRNLVRIDELLTELVKDEHYRIKDPKGNRLHDAFNALGTVGINLRILKQRMEKEL